MVLREMGGPRKVGGAKKKEGATAAMLQTCRNDTVDVFFFLEKCSHV